MERGREDVSCEDVLHDPIFFHCMGEKERGKRRKTYSIISTLHALAHTPKGTRRATVAKKEEEEERGEVDREEKITHDRILFHCVREMNEWERRKEVEGEGKEIEGRM